MNERINVYLEVEACCDCGIAMFMEVNQQAQFKKTKQTFYCVNGHPQSYTKNTEDFLRIQLEQRNEKINSLEREILGLKRSKKAKKKV